MSGHVFIVHGDLRQLSCDAWLMPTDLNASPLKRWMGWPAEERHYFDPVAPKRWAVDGLRTFKLEGWPEGRPQPWLTNVGASPRLGIPWFVEGAAQFLEHAADDVVKDAPRCGRARHLLALPIVGTGFGGARRYAGEMVRELLPVLEEFARRREMDVALVTIEGAAFAAAQAERARRDGKFSELDAPLKAHGERLAKAAAEGNLVLFLGAGVSAGAGMPTWGRLLDDLGEEAGMMPEERAALSSLNVLDQAGILEKRLGGGAALSQAVARRCDAFHPALSHFLLAALPVREAVTTNYDRLFEIASESTMGPVSVLPHAALPGAPRWLLKMHGCVSVPEDIVLTREDYMRYEARRAALAGIVQALLITRHMLFVGFSLNDDNFHRITDAVRRAMRPAEGKAKKERFGTSLSLRPEPLMEELWRDDVEWVPLGKGGKDPSAFPRAARRLEILLDFVLARATTAGSHLLEPRYEPVLSPADKALRDVVNRLLVDVPPEARDAAGWGRVAELIRSFGGDPEGWTAGKSRFE